MDIDDLTPEIVTPIFEELVREYGNDYVYKTEERSTEWEVSCQYQEYGEPSCVVGHILHRAGVEYNPVWDLDGHRANTLFTNPMGQLPEALDTAQLLQDSGETWGEALVAYRRLLSESTDGTVYVTATKEEKNGGGI